jgi:hypothetical protein
MSIIAHSLENHTDGDDVSLARRPLFTQKHFLVFISVKSRVRPRAIVRLEGLCKLRKNNDHIGNLTRDLLISNLVSERTALLRAPAVLIAANKIHLRI